MAWIIFNAMCLPFPSGITTPIQPEYRAPGERHGLDWFAKVALIGPEMALAAAPFFEEEDGTGDNGVLHNRADSDADFRIGTWEIAIGIRPPVVTMSKYCRREILNSLLARRAEFAVRVLHDARPLFSLDPALEKNEQKLISPFAFSLVSPSYAVLAAYATSSSVSPFYDVPGVSLLAQLDAMYGLFPSSLPKFFIDLCYSSGGFSEFLSWRLPAGECRGLLFRCGTGAIESTDVFPNTDTHKFVYCYAPVLDILSAGTALDLIHDRISEFLCAADDRKRKLASEETTLVSLVVSDCYAIVKQTHPSSAMYFSEHVFQMHMLGNIIIAMSTLQKGGTLVLRFGDSLTRFSASMLYCLHKSFATIRIVKPYTSSTFENDRVVLCQGFLGPQVSMLSHLDSVQVAAREIEKSSGRCILNFVAMSDLLGQGFMRFLTHANERLILREIASLKLLGGFIETPPDESGNYPMYDPTLVGVQCLERLSLTHQ